MKVIITVAALHSSLGGPARTVPALCEAIAAAGVKIELITISEGEASNSTEEAHKHFKFTRIVTRGGRYSPRTWHRQFKGALASAAGGPETVLYDVGLWLPQNHFVAKFAGTRGLPLIISPRGMLSARALEVSPWKKRLAWLTYQKADLNRASVLHVTSDAEAKDCRRRGLTQPIAVVPNGIDVPANPSRTTNPNGEMRSVLFLSRLHPIKGLKDLVEAWARVRPVGWRMVIAGPDENGHQREIESQVKALTLSDQFDFVGPVGDKEKWDLYAAADLFVLPSYSESFGQVVGEALAAGVPVITTQATPWQKIEVNRCGWWIETGVESLARALQTATRLDSPELNEMGQRGREMVMNDYSWRSSARRMLEVMTWLVGKADKPSWLL
jgi:glycosyltransferase involved in cell wall biosynthesis